VQHRDGGSSGPPSLFVDRDRLPPVRMGLPVGPVRERSKPMSSPNEFSEPSTGPEAVIAQLAHWLLGTTAQCVLGLVLGVLAARALRHRHLHWSWATAALAVVVLAPSVLGSATLTVAVAALSAIGRGRRWHREDIEAGKDLARLASHRRGPLEMLRASLRMAAIRRRQTGGETAWFRGNELIVGMDEGSRVVPIPFDGDGGGTHTLVVGATGSGKTITQTWIAVRAIGRGMGAIVVDPKGDRGMRDELRRAAQAAGRRFVEWTPDGGSVYNPYAGGSETEIADKALAGERFTEPHYLRQAQRYLGYAVRALRKSGAEVSLALIVENLDPGRLEILARGLPEADARLTHTYLDSLTARQQRDLAGVRDRLAILTESDVGPWLDPQTSGAEPCELLEAARERAVVYFNLESDSRPLLSQMLGAAIVQDLQTTVAALQRRPEPTLVVIDEFSALAAEQVVRLFGRARSAGFSLLLGTQELSDLRPPGRERLLEQVMGNLSVLIAHRQVVPGSTELIARVAGERGAWKISRHSDGRTTRIRTSEPVLDPNQVMSLTPGRAAVLVLGGSRSARIARIFAPGWTG
jgi:TraM recognition site of TraD and TraG/Type IV secretion-system coupling protein DNA-binding domain